MPRVIIMEIGNIQVLFALHSDFTMAPAQPLLAMWIAVNRQTVMGEEI